MPFRINKKGQSSHKDAVQVLTNFFKEGFIVTYRGGTVGVFGWEDGRRKGKTRREVISNYLRRHQRGRNDTKVNETPLNYVEESGEAAILYSDIDEEVTVYELAGENKRLLRENKKIIEEIGRLKERLALERHVTGGTTFNRNQLDAVAGHIRKNAAFILIKKNRLQISNRFFFDTYIL